MARVRKVINATPDTRLLTPEGIGATNLTLGEALGEIVANSLDWSLLSKQEAKNISSDAADHKNAAKFLNNLESEYGSLGKVISDDPPVITIETDLSAGTISIIDQGVGMTIDELQDAMSLRHASDKIRAPLRMRKGKFGMGLKVAALGLGETFSIETRSIKTPGTTLQFPFDSRSFANQDEWTGLPVYENDEFEANSPLGDRSHGTAIIISDLFGRLSKDDALDARELLCTIFHQALGDPINSVITFNGAPLVPSRPKMNKDVEILKLDDFDLWVKEDLGGGRRGEPIQIRGWVGLTEITKSGDLKYGFHTFRRNQLIEQFHNAGFGADPPGLWPYRTPHSELARLFGHIHLDMVPPNFHKKGWNTKSDAWSEVVDALKDVLEKIVLLARKTTKDVKKSKDLLGAWTRFAKTKEWKVPKKTSRPRRKIPKEDDDTPPPPETPFNMDGYDYLFLRPDDLYDFVEGNPPWDFIADHESHEIQLRLHLGHPIFQFATKGGETILSKIAQIDVFCQMMIDRGYSTAEVQGKKEHLYYQVFSEK